MRGLRRRPGFTLVELLVVMVLLSILAGIALPKLRRAIVRAYAADAIADMDVIQVGAVQYYGEHERWPPDAGRGSIPAGLSDFLPDGFSFVQEKHVLDWDNWSGQEGGFVAISVITDDDELGDILLALLGSAGTWSNGVGKYSMVIDWD